MPTQTPASVCGHQQPPVPPARGHVVHGYLHTRPPRRVEIQPRDTRSASTRIKHREKLEKITKALQNATPKAKNPEISESERQKLKEIMTIISQSEEKTTKKMLERTTST